MRAPEIWLVLLRVVVGAWFLKAVWTKFTLTYAFGVLPYPEVAARFIAFHPRRVAEFAAGNPLPWYRAFLENTVLPNAATFARLQAWGEAAVGVGLLLGFLTPLAAVIGLFLTLQYGLASQWMSFGQQGFHLLLATSMVAILGAGAGRVAGVDGWLIRHVPARARRWLEAVS
jgi:uncharacterized membrane protein YphA (DoxX/SURF4 family)